MERKQDIRERRRNDRPGSRKRGSHPHQEALTTSFSSGTDLFSVRFLFRPSSLSLTRNLLSLLA